MVNAAQGPLLFLVSEPVGGPAANEVARLLAERGVRTWVGSLAPDGQLDETAMAVLRGAAAVLLLFDEAAASSLHVDRHLLVARQTGKPIIPLRLQHADEGLLRQELGDADWVDWSQQDAAILEVSRRAYRYEQMPPAQPEEPAPAPVAPAPAAAPEPVAAARPVSRRRKGPSVELILGVLLVLAVAVAMIVTTRQGSQSEDEREAVAEARPAPGPVAPPAELPVSSDNLAAAAPLPSSVSEPVVVREPAARLEPTPDVLESIDAPEEPRREASAGRSSAAETARAFYGALGRGDGSSAAQLVVPGKRDAGPLSASALTRYYSSLRRPLRVTGVSEAGEGSAVVTYDYVTGDGRACRGRATVDVGGRGQIERIRTAGPC